MKTTLKKVYNKLPNQKVSLGSISELQRASDLLTIDSTVFLEIEHAISNANDLDTSLSTVLYESKRFIENYKLISSYDGLAQDNLSEIQTILRDFEVKADELGIDASSVELYNDLEEQAEELLEFSNEVSRFVDEYDTRYKQAVSIVDSRL